MTPKKTVFMLVGILLVIIGLGIAAFYYGDNILQIRSKKISLEKANLEAIEAEISIFEDSKEKVEEYGFIIDLIDKILPESKYQSEVIAELKAFSVENNMQITSLTFSGGETAVSSPQYSQTKAVEGLEGVRVLSASIQFDTDPSIAYNDFLGFLRKIENNQRKMQVTSITVSPSAEDRTRLGTASVTVDMYLQESTQ